MFFFAGLDAKTVAKYLELRKIAEDRKKEEARKAEQLRIASSYFAPRFVLPTPLYQHATCAENKGSDGKLK